MTHSMRAVVRDNCTLSAQRLNSCFVRSAAMCHDVPNNEAGCWECLKARLMIIGKQSSGHGRGSLRLLVEQRGEGPAEALGVPHPENFRPVAFAH